MLFAFQRVDGSITDQSEQCGDGSRDLFPDRFLIIDACAVRRGKGRHDVDGIADRRTRGEYGVIHAGKQLDVFRTVSPFLKAFRPGFGLVIGVFVDVPSYIAPPVSLIYAVVTACNEEVEIALGEARSILSCCNGTKEKVVIVISGSNGGMSLT